MPQNFFVSGLPKAGKTTLLRELMKELKKSGLKVGGFISPEEKHHGTRTGFYVEDIDSGRIGRLAEIKGDGPKVSKYHVDVKSFENVVVPALDDFEKYDVVFIDEIGSMELKSRKFASILDRLLESDTPLVASLNKDYISKYELHGDVMELGADNHQDVYLTLLKNIKESVTKKPQKKEAPPKAQKKPEKKTVAKKPVKMAEKKEEQKKEEHKKVEETPPEHKEEHKPKKEEKKGFFDKLRDMFR